MSSNEGSPCAACGVLTTPQPIEDGAWEWYMVHDDVWIAAGMQPFGRGFLCIACLEDRLGRSLTPADFPDFPVNLPSPLDSPLLASRLAG